MPYFWSPKYHWKSFFVVSYLIFIVPSSYTFSHRSSLLLQLDGIDNFQCIESFTILRVCPVFRTCKGMHLSILSNFFLAGAWEEVCVQVCVWPKTTSWLQCKWVEPTSGGVCQEEPECGAALQYNMMMDRCMWLNIICISWHVYFFKLKNQNRPTIVIYNFMKIC